MKYIFSLIAVSIAFVSPFLHATEVKKITGKEIAKGDGGGGDGGQAAQEEAENQEIMQQDITSQEMEMKRGKAG